MLRPGVYQATVAGISVMRFLPRSAPACLSHGRRHFFHDMAGVEHSVGAKSGHTCASFRGSGRRRRPFYIVLLPHERNLEPVLILIVGSV